MKKYSKASKVLGILSICLFWLTWPATILSIIGLSIKKGKNRFDDIALNVVGLVLSFVYTIYILSNFMYYF